MSCHSNFGISEMSDEFDVVLHKTVADLANPPRVPHETPKHNFVTFSKAKMRTKGYPTSKTEGFVGPE